MSIQHLLPVSHAGQRIARTLIVGTGLAVVCTSTLAIMLAQLALR